MTIVADPDTAATEFRFGLQTRVQDSSRIAGVDVLNPSGLTLRDSTLYGTTVGDFGRCWGFAVLNGFSHHLARTNIGFGTSSTTEILM